MNRHALFLFILCIAAAPCPAQWSVHADRLWTSDVATIDIDDLSEALLLSPEQRSHIERVLDEHREDFTELVKRGRIVEEDARCGRRTIVPPDTWQAAREELTKLVKQQRRLQQEALGRIAPVLSDTQREQWRREQMALRRDWWLDRGSAVAEEEVDLIALLDELDQTANRSPDTAPQNWRDDDALEALMHQYAAQLDALIIDRRRRQIDIEHDNWDRLVRQHGNGAISPDERETFKRDRRALGRLHEQIRDLNRQYRNLVLTHLPQDRTALFQEAYRAVGWPYQGRNRLPGLRFAEDLLEDESLPDPPREIIQSLLQRHHLEADVLLDRMTDGVDQETLLSFDHDVARDRVDKVKADIRRHVWRYYDLDDALIKSVWNVLPPEQREAQKKPQPADRAWLDRIYPE